MPSIISKWPCNHQTLSANSLKHNHFHSAEVHFPFTSPTLNPSSTVNHLHHLTPTATTTPRKHRPVVRRGRVPRPEQEKERESSRVSCRPPPPPLTSNQNLNQPRSSFHPNNIPAATTATRTSTLSPCASQERKKISALSHGWAALWGNFWTAKARKLFLLLAVCVYSKLR